jgi:hypothetical protein
MTGKAKVRTGGVRHSAASQSHTCHKNYAAYDPDALSWIGHGFEPPSKEKKKSCNKRLANHEVWHCNTTKCQQNLCIEAATASPVPDHSFHFNCDYRHILRKTSHAQDWHS